MRTSDEINCECIQLLSYVWKDCYDASSILTGMKARLKELHKLLTKSSSNSEKCRCVVKRRKFCFNNAYSKLIIKMM